MLIFIFVISVSSWVFFFLLNRFCLRLNFHMLWAWSWSCFSDTTFYICVLFVSINCVWDLFFFFFILPFNNIFRNSSTLLVFSMAKLQLSWVYSFCIFRFIDLCIICICIIYISSAFFGFFYCTFPNFLGLMLSVLSFRLSCFPI